MDTSKAHTQEIVIFTGQGAAHSAPLFGGGVAHYFPDYREFREASVKPAAFIIKNTDEQWVGTLLKQLRRDPEHAISLVFVDGALARKDGQLCDGALPKTRQALVDRLTETRSRTRAMGHAGDNLTPEMLLLRFMWLRPGYILEPQADWQHSRHYHYPILEALDRSDSDPDTWLQKMDRDGLLEKVALKDRQHECDFCGSAHLGFVDICPRCRSIDIDQNAALHCFTCGLIAPEERFIRNGQRHCPKCGTHLRHIGSDYDRPLETHSCRSCSHVFVEGEVIARCMNCGRSAAPTSLRQSSYYSWRIAGAGRLAVQRQDASAAQASLHGGSQQSRFTEALDLMLKVARSQNDFDFGLMGLRLNNREPLEKSIGAVNTVQLIDAYVERLEESLEDTDVIARMDDDTVFILLPNDDRKRNARIRAAVKSVTTWARQESGACPQWTASNCFVTHKEARNSDTESLLARLGTSLNKHMDQAA